MRPRNGCSICGYVGTVSIFKRADAAWEKGHKEKAFELFLEAALLGESSAQHNVGFFYDVGIGTRKDSRKALFWYKKAWRADKQTGTCINIAQIYASKNSIRSALVWWRKAISLGDGDAVLALAKFHLNREGVRNRAQGISLLRKVKASRRVTQEALEEAAKLLKYELQKVG